MPRCPTVSAIMTAKWRSVRGEIGAFLATPPQQRHDKTIMPALTDKKKLVLEYSKEHAGEGRHGVFCE